MPTKTTKQKITCFYCGNTYVDTNYYKSKSVFFNNIGRLPYCKQCVEKMYQHYYKLYTNEGSLIPEKKAIKRACMAFDIFYSDDAYASAMRRRKDKDDISPMASYMREVQLVQYSKYTYDKTVENDEQDDFEASVSSSSYEIDVAESIINFFGKGFNEEDYKFLDREYQDWTARHECNTKAQEEVFKRLCFTQLELAKATLRGDDTKNLNDTYLKQLDAAKLQPKQNKGDTTAETQTFGTLIDKWENTRPLPDIDEELKDVDKIGLYIDVFFKGHLSKMMGLKNGLSNLYTNFMKKYTVDKPEYSDEENSEILFDAIFGNSSSVDDKEVV